MSNKSDLKFAQRLASAHNNAYIAYRHELRVQLGDEAYHTWDQMATNARKGLFEFVRARAQKLLATADTAKPSPEARRADGGVGKE